MIRTGPALCIKKSRQTLGTAVVLVIVLICTDLYTHTRTNRIMPSLSEDIAW